MNLSNPREKAVIEDWPIGRKRCTATFQVEDGGKKGQRVARTTTGKPKRTTYYQKVMIVDGDDGRTYIIARTEHNQAVVIPGTLKTTEYFYEGSPEYDMIRALLG
jgi:hypothetical protein